LEIDKNTLYDLSIFSNEEGQSIFDKLDFTSTTGGHEKLISLFSRSLTSIEEINNTQNSLKLLIEKKRLWPKVITNGTLMVVNKFYEYLVDQIPERPSVISAYTYKTFHANDFSIVKYSVSHCFDLIKGMDQVIQVFLDDTTPNPLKNTLERARMIIEKEKLSLILKKDKLEELTSVEMLSIAGFIRYHYKQNILELIDIYHLLDAWHSMAMATEELNLSFPVFKQQAEPSIQAVELHHVLLSKPVPYDITLTKDVNFIFLTGANMAGKSTFIKSVGSAVFLAHIGMGVPARSMELTLFDGLLSNINVIDNIVKGESYFYNEVQRIKTTISKINNGKKWLVLIDELFKGTNVQDAMRCSTTVIKGLLKIKNSIFVLSTHLYEIAEELKEYSNIDFEYFETTVVNDQLQFTYNLHPGISNDRIGYLILKREGVVDMLEGL
jgi:DNA mismatch repair protein MutS